MWRWGAGVGWGEDSTVCRWPGIPSVEKTEPEWNLINESNLERKEEGGEEAGRKRGREGEKDRYSTQMWEPQFWLDPGKP